MAANQAATAVGWCPFARRCPTPNLWVGNKGRKAVVLHIAEGTYGGTIGWFARAESGVSAHFLIGPGGEIAQFVSVYDSAWANGATWNADHWVDPDGRAIHPTWPGMAPPTNPNWTTISVEHAGRSGDAWPAAMTEASTRLLRWLAAACPTLAPYAPHHTLIGHNEISPLSRANCPGPACDLAALARAANIRAYRALHTQAVFEAPDPRARVALGGTAEIPKGTVVGIDEILPSGWAHIGHASEVLGDVGFVPVGVLAAV